MVEDEMAGRHEIAYDDLEYLPEGRFLLDGKPFTGLTIDRDQSGRKVCEVPFVDGREHGIARSWYPTGQIQSETPYVHGADQGVSREWHEDGSLRSEAVFEFGVLMRKQVYDKNGRAIEWFERPQSDVLYQNVLRRRTEGG